MVDRPHLVDQLNEGLRVGGKLALISAPAGFGKTTLVSHWVAGLTRPVAWLSLDEADNDIARFLAYLVATLRTVAPAIGEGLPDLLQSSQPPPVEAVLTVLLNDVDALAQEFILVLDDYHVVEARSLDDAVTFLLEHLPPRMYLVITTREDPYLPLARLRARGQLTELRAGDLRFTRAEAGGFLNQVMGLSLSTENIALLETRTEGWIAGLKLAALAIQGTISMQGHRDISTFIQAFAGDHRYILDFLVEEVLQRQPDSVRSFLLQTSILQRLTGPLCDAVTGQENGQAQLEALERGNFFTIPLTDQRRWYRYHHLFAEVLSVHLRAELPDQLPLLHRRASEWYEQHDLMPDAIRHALSAGDSAHAADMVERAAPAIRRARQDATLLGWLQALPDEVLYNRPVLSAGYAHVLLASGALEGVEERLRDAERGMQALAEKPAMVRESPEPAAATIVVDVEAFRRLPAEIAIARTAMALARGDVPQTVTHAARALELAAEDDHLTRGAAAGFLGLAYWTNGDLQAAHELYAQGMASLQRAGNISDAMNGANTLAAIRVTQGRLRDAMRTYERALQLGTEQGSVGPRGAADIHVGMSELCREWGDLETAGEHLLKSREMGEHSGFPQNRHRRRVAMARLREAQGDLDAALELLDDAERLYMSDFSPNVRPIAAMKARLWLTTGRLPDALNWAREQGLSSKDEMSYLREFEHITLVRLLLARYQIEREAAAIPEALRLLQRLLKAAEDGQRMGSVVEILMLQALAYQAQGDSAAALAPLARALALAEPEGYVRLFVDEGEPMALLLREAARQAIAAGYVRHLLSALGKPPGRPLANGHLQLLEPLSDRELEVLRLLSTDLSGPELARELMVSLSTIRTHIRNIYSKLGVNSRRTAVRRAMELDLL